MSEGLGEGKNQYFIFLLKVKECFTQTKEVPAFLHFIPRMNQFTKCVFFKDTLGYYLFYKIVLKYLEAKQFLL